MKYRIIIIAAIMVFLSLENGFALRSKKDYFLRPQVGVWFGPITPILTTNEDIDTNLGGGIYFRYNTPFQYLKIGLDSSYQKYEAQNENKLYMIPVYSSFVFLLPIKLPIRFQFKTGVGGAYVFMKPDNVKQWDPLFMGGGEFSFPAGRTVNIGLRVEYLYIYEGYMKNSDRSGHFINTGLTIYFNI